jgi:hypothetical protein
MSDNLLANGKALYPHGDLLPIDAKPGKPLIEKCLDENQGLFPI